MEKATATEADAVALTSNLVVMSPLRVGDVMDDKGLDAFSKSGNVTTILLDELTKHDFVGIESAVPNKYFTTRIGNGAGIPAIQTNGYVLINGRFAIDSDVVSQVVAGESLYMMAIATDIGSGPILVMQSDTGLFLKLKDQENTAVFTVDHDGQTIIRTSGLIVHNLDPTGVSFVAIAQYFGIGIAIPTSPCHVVGTASDTIPIARIVGANAGGTHVILRLVYDASGTEVGWDFRRSGSTGALEIIGNQSFCDVGILDSGSTGKVGIGKSSSLVYKLDVAGDFGATAINAFGANGQSAGIKQLTELLTIAAAATSTTTIQKPANSIILGVSVRVTVALPITSTFTVGDSGSAARFSTAAVSKAINSTDKGTKAGAYYNATAEGIIITPDATPGTTAGRVRVTIYYLEITAPTS